MKSRTSYCVLVVLVLWRRQPDSWDSLASQPRLLAEAQPSDRDPVSKIKVGSNLRLITNLHMHVYSTHMYMYTHTPKIKIKGVVLMFCLNLQRMCFLLSTRGVSRAQPAKQEGKHSRKGCLATLPCVPGGPAQGPVVETK